MFTLNSLSLIESVFTYIWHTLTEVFHLVLSLVVWLCVRDRGFVTRYVFIWTRPADLINARSRIMYTSRDHLCVGSLDESVLSSSRSWCPDKQKKKTSYLLSRGGKVKNKKQNRINQCFSKLLCNDAMWTAVAEPLYFRTYTRYSWSRNVLFEPYKILGKWHTFSCNVHPCRISLSLVFKIESLFSNLSLHFFRIWTHIKYDFMHYLREYF